MPQNKKEQNKKYRSKHEQFHAQKPKVQCVEKKEEQEQPERTLQTSKSQRKFVENPAPFSDTRENKPRKEDKSRREYRANKRHGQNNHNDKKYKFYEEKSQMISAEILIDEKDVKKLKKLFIELVPSANKISLKYLPNKPCLIFCFSEDKNEEALHFRDVIHKIQEGKQIRNFELFDRVFGSIYRKLQQKYFKIGMFGLQLTKEKKIRFRGNNFCRKSTKVAYKQFPIYFSTKDTKINFLMFDSQVNNVEFNTKVIIEKKDKLPDIYEIYKQFQEKIANSQKENQFNFQNFGQEQVDSDNEERQKKVVKQKDHAVADLKLKLAQFINKDLSSYQQDIEEKNQEYQVLVQTNRRQTRDRMLKLGDQVMQQQASLDNYIEVKTSVEKKMELKFNSDEQQKKVLKGCLKRLILAEKQLDCKLPIISKKREIFQKLENNNLLVLEGQTGSGKSTQLPQMLCEYYKIFQNQQALPVLITQPRKLATRTLAERVANQMQEHVHGFVDYQTSLLSQTNPKAKIIFKMDRLVLDELKVDPKLSKYCCLVIDEAHERTISIDVILGLIKNLLTLRNDFKIIVTSASMDTDLFKKYFKTQVLKVSGRMFPVQEIFEPYDSQKEVTNKIKRLIDDKILENSGQRLRQNYRGHVLTFCNGLDQITDLVNYYSKKLNERVFKVFALHGKLSPEEQREVFRETSQHKIIFATRIAETSITIDGVKVVIDPGEDREMVYDQKNKITSMKLKKISISSAKQRAGRAGRTNQGFCFRLYSKAQKNKMSVNKVPEIQNMALETVVLRLKSLNIQDIINFPYLSPPDREGLENSEQLMKMLDCLDVKTAKITTIGEFLVKLPMQPFLARAIVEAMLMDFILKNDRKLTDELKMDPKEKINFQNPKLAEQTIRVLCMVLNASNLFWIKAQDREKADKKKFENLSDQDGDFFFLLNIYNKYIEFYNSRKTEAMKRWARQHYLSLKTLNQVRDLQRQISQQINNEYRSLQNLQDVTAGLIKKIRNLKTYRQMLLSCLVSSFSTNLALNSTNQTIGYTVISSELPIQVYGSSILSLQGISPKWILFYDLYENEKGQMYCKVANSVSIEFLKDNVNPYVYEKYQIGEAQNTNPFYQEVRIKLPTLIYRHLLTDYQKRFYDGCKFPMMQKFFINFYEDLNQICVFYRTKDDQDLDKKGKKQASKKTKQFLSRAQKILGVQQKQQPQEDMQKCFRNYIKQIQSQYSKELRYNYIGPIYINIKEGFELDSIDMNTLMYSFKIQAEPVVKQWLYRSVENVYEIEGELYSDKVVFRMMNGSEVKQFEQILQNLILLGREQFGIDIRYRKDIEDTRKKIPNNKLYIRFWAGERSKNGGRGKDNILISYHDYKNYGKRTNVQEMLKCLQNIPREENLDFKLTKKGDAINCFVSKNVDECDLAEIINRKFRDKTLGYNFKMPISYRMFREPDFKQSSKTQETWKKQILALLKQNKFEEEKILLRVWGQERRFKPDQDVGAFQRSLKIDWYAELISFDMAKMQHLQRIYDKKTGIIGTQKIHINFLFEQIIPAVSDRVFGALRDYFDDIVEDTKSESPLVMIEWNIKKRRTASKVYISVRGTQRDEILRPAKRIQQLFSPQIIVLSQPEFCYLNKTKDGANILERIEQQYKYTIYFGFDPDNSTIKLYCEQYEVKQIQKQLKEKLSLVKIIQEQVSYRGKNLHKVMLIINKKMLQIQTSLPKQKIMVFEVLFKFRKVMILADSDTLNEVKNQIMKLIQKDKPQCEICYGLLQKPYRLSGCNHQFCTFCLLSHIRQSINKSSQGLKCLSCPAKISVHDVQKILSTSDFNRLCDIVTARYISGNQKYHGCLSPSCQNIFLTSQSEAAKYFECNLCAKWYCYKCKKSHRGEQCENWKIMQDVKELQKLGIKKCPKCSEGVYKDKGCLHITCAKCKCHFCWRCLKHYQSSNQVYDHLRKQHGGIFDDEEVARQNQRQRQLRQQNQARRREVQQPRPVQRRVELNLRGLRYEPVVQYREPEVMVEARRHPEANLYVQRQHDDRRDLNRVVPQQPEVNPYRRPQQQHNYPPYPAPNVEVPARQPLQPAPVRRQPLNGYFEHQRAFQQRIATQQAERRRRIQQQQQLQNRLRSQRIQNHQPQRRLRQGQEQNREQGGIVNWFKNLFK